MITAIKNWLEKHNFRKPKLPEQKQPTVKDIVEIYNFHHNHATNALNLIMSSKMGNQYMFSFMSVQDQIIIMRDNLYFKQQEMIKKENYPQAAKFRDDIVRMDELIEQLQR